MKRVGSSGPGISVQFRALLPRFQALFTNPAEGLARFIIRACIAMSE
jgi:hypothetical protein